VTERGPALRDRVRGSLRALLVTRHCSWAAGEDAVEKSSKNCAFAERRSFIFNKLTALFCKPCVV
jgi:hypothetical protein